MPKAPTGAHTNSSTLALALCPDSQEERQRRILFSYQLALGNQHRSRLANFPWATWAILLVTCVIWGLTAYQVALRAGAHSFWDTLVNIFTGDENADVLIAFGAKYNPDILAGQYWRLITPIFLHANLLHVGLNMFNFLLLGLVVEHIYGHLRFLLIYLLAGLISILASFMFAPQDVSIGASGAIFGLVGAYGFFILAHRRAFPYQGIAALAWLVVITGMNLGLGFVLSGIDNYAHMGGLLGGCLLGWCFTPFYTTVTTHDGQLTATDIHSLKRRWPLALLLIILTVLSAIIAIHFVGG